MSQFSFSTPTNDNVVCRLFFNDDYDNGVEVTVNDEYLGTMIGVSLPTTDDYYDEDGKEQEEEVTDFIDEVETWIIENE
jgi:hypothetical protein